MHTVEVYVGDYEDYTKNTRCPDGPYLKSTYDDVWDAYANKFVPKYGIEAWCNMRGQYVHFVASGVPSESVTICSVGIMGTRYVRDQPLVSQTV